MWGIIHMIVELLMKHDDGKYVMMKVNTTRLIGSYRVSPLAIFVSFVSFKFQCKVAGRCT